ncbi:MAG TPA: bifunctional riboflavin kinase/FMN adenylyltransferase, partial [Halomonas sp.]|nr:bifunctional riboflavin kinase/FMN adenylyltransferase [Halomonas sp.]
HPAVANVGFRPTVGAKRPTLEVHLLDFSGDLYGQRLTVYPCTRLRGEVKFDDFDALKAQIHQDQAKARRYFATADADLTTSLPLASAPLGRETASSDFTSADDAADTNDG